MIFIMVFLLQWNARSLLANGQEFKKYIDELPSKPEVMCLQESWLRPNLDFRISGYMAIRCDRMDGVGGGCATFIREDVPFREVGIGKEQEYVSVEIWTEEGECAIVNYYNPCKKLDLMELLQIEGMECSRVIMCGDFNAHSTLWGGTRSDVNGDTMEQVLEEKNMVCLNDGTGTRIDVHTGKTSALDLTLVTRNLAGICEWEVVKDTTVGSDHFMILCQVGLQRRVAQGAVTGRGIFSRADWEMFRHICEEEMDKIDLGEEIETIDRKIRTSLIEAAIKTIPRSKGKMKKKAVPWWTEECSKVVKDRNALFKILRKNVNYQNLIKYKKAQAMVRKVVRKAKRQSWKNFCNKIGRTTPVGEVWGMIKSMRGIRKEKQYPVLKMREEIAVSDKEKAEMIAKALISIHSSDNLTEEGKRGREATMSAHPGILDRREGSGRF